MNVWASDRLRSVVWKWEAMLNFYWVVAKGATSRQGGGSEEWYGGTQRQPLSLMEKTKNVEKSKLKSKRGDMQQGPDSFYSKSFLIGPDLRTVSKGSALHMQWGAVSSSGLSLASPI